jgi:hypothetical protein
MNKSMEAEWVFPNLTPAFVFQHMIDINKYPPGVYELNAVAFNFNCTPSVGLGDEFQLSGTYNPIIITFSAGIIFAYQSELKGIRLKSNPDTFYCSNNLHCCKWKCWYCSL